MRGLGRSGLYLSSSGLPCIVDPLRTSPRRPREGNREDARSLQTSSENLVLRSEPLPSRALAGGGRLYSSDRPHPIHRASAKQNHRWTPPASDTPRVSIIIALPKESPPPGEFSFDHSRTEPRTREARAGGTLPSPCSLAHHRDGCKPVTAFVVPKYPAPPVSTGLPPSTALQKRGRASARSYLRHSPRERGLNYLVDLDQAPETTPVPILLPRLGVTFQEHVTSLEGVIPRA